MRLLRSHIRPRRLALVGIAAALFLIAAAAQAERVVRGNLEIAVLGRLEPYRLPRTRTAPISVIVFGRLLSTDGTTPPQLKRLTIDLNRHGVLRSRGLPVCRIPRIQPASSGRALKNCGRALIGRGQFWAHIVLPDQRPYKTEGRLLAFNGKAHGRPILLVHVFTSNPFFTSFVISFSIRHIAKGPWGTELSTDLPPALGSWGYVEEIKMTLKRQYRYRGKERSYFNAACAAPRGFKAVLFPFARASFYFANAPPLSTTLTRPCAVAG